MYTIIKWYANQIFYLPNYSRVTTITETKFGVILHYELFFRIFTSSLCTFLAATLLMEKKKTFTRTHVQVSSYCRRTQRGTAFIRCSKCTTQKPKKPTNRPKKKKNVLENRCARMEFETRSYRRLTFSIFLDSERVERNVLLLQCFFFLFLAVPIEKCHSAKKFAKCT